MNHEILNSILSSITGAITASFYVNWRLRSSNTALNRVSQSLTEFQLMTKRFEKRIRIHEAYIRRFNQFVRGRLL